MVAGTGRRSEVQVRREVVASVSSMSRLTLASVSRAGAVSWFWFWYGTEWNGTEWVVFGDNNLGVPVVTYTPTWSGTGLAFTGTPAIGRYSRVGKMITYNIQVTCTTVTNFGTGQYSITLPAGLPSGYSFQHIGGLHKNSDHFTLLADLGAGSTSVTLYHPAANGSQDIFSHNKPTVLTTGSTWYISGTYFLA